MKKISFLSLLLMVVPILSMPLFSFTTGFGGDVFEIYLNGKQLHQQFVHIDNSVKSIQLSSFNESDKLEVFYSHCGVMGTNRVLSLRNEQNEVVKEFKYGNTTSKRSLMVINRKDIGKMNDNKVKLFYRSSELQAGKQLATITWNAGQRLARR
jgi:hypothetical protein